MGEDGSGDQAEIMNDFNEDGKDLIIEGFTDMGSEEREGGFGRDGIIGDAGVKSVVVTFGWVV